MGKTNADNALNRRHGREGQPRGSMSQTSSGSNANVNLPHGSAVSKRPQSAKTTGQKPTPRTQHVAERQGTSTVDSKYEDRKTPPKQSEKPVTYANNALNIKLGRVGLPLGSMVYSKSTKTITSRVYADTPLNRNLGRVGKPLGSMPRKNIVTNKIPEMIEKLRKQDKNEIDEENGTESKDQSRAALQQAMCHNNRQRAEDSWKVSNKEPPKTEMSMLRDYTGKRIAYNELQLHSKIGHGGFGEIYFAKWRETVVAVKALKIEKMTDKDVNTFAEEVLKFCHLNHPNIVKFIGACTERPDICIVMEYMMFSLFDAIHVRQIQFADEEKLSINQQICKGINYLHDKRIAHCDIKTANILMDYVENNICEVKITDFGLSLVTNATLSLSQPQVQYRGTPRYSAPEILRGEILGIRDMMHADVYSLGLVMFEIIYEEEPYHDFTAIQMQKQVGEHGVMPEISNDIIVDPNVLDIIHKAWNFEPHLRPKIGKISDFMNRTVAIFVENEC